MHELKLLSANACFFRKYSYRSARFCTLLAPVCVHQSGELTNNAMVQIILTAMNKDLFLR